MSEEMPEHYWWLLKLNEYPCVITISRSGFKTLINFQVQLLQLFWVSQLSLCSFLFSDQYFSQVGLWPESVLQLLHQRKHSKESQYLPIHFPIWNFLSVTKNWFKCNLTIAVLCLGNKFVGLSNCGSLLSLCISRNISWSWLSHKKGTSPWNHPH